MGSDHLVDKVVQVATVYLGPSAERFIYRQVTIHLKKQPQELAESDLQVLADWSKLALGLITDNRQEVDQIQRDILGLLGSSGRKPAARTKAARKSVRA